MTQQEIIKQLNSKAGITLEEKEGKYYYSGYLDLEGCTGITDTSKVKRELNVTQRAIINKQSNGPFIWEWSNRKYIKVDDIFTILDEQKGNVYRVHKIGSDKQMYIVTDGSGHFAHGNTIAEAKDDLIYKINDRDTSVYKNLSMSDELAFEEAIAAYRTITGACAAGTRNFIEGRLPTPHKEKYTIGEIITLTEGEYGSKLFRDFF